ncbi:MAG: hypothetical protein GY718_09935, partial [Lentisphaerae bacterium]|nr:hypothetical protein [Lentisphaerota bacterium]
QNDLESMTGVFQSKISRFEKNGIQCLNDSEKELIEQALDMIDQIDWNANLNKKGQGMATCKISGNDYPKYRHREKMDTGK